MSSLREGRTEHIRCGWCGTDELYVAYHDHEWGVPERDPQQLFERLVLEGMQAGLSWLTVLKKRARMQEVFFGFDMHKLAAVDETQMQHWLQDVGIIRHRGKLQAMVHNARLTLERDNFSEWLWSFAPAGPACVYQQSAEVPGTTQDAQAMSHALKREGYKFVGPTICYAFMQSVGMVNDHLTACFRHDECAALAAD